MRIVNSSTARHRNDARTNVAFAQLVQHHVARRLDDLDLDGVVRAELVGEGLRQPPFRLVRLREREGRAASAEDQDGLGHRDAGGAHGLLLHEVPLLRLRRLRRGGQEGRRGRRHQEGKATTRHGGASER